MAIAAIFFFVSLIGLALLFSLKAAEAKRGAPYAPHSRAVADRVALLLKDQLLEMRKTLSRIPPTIVVLGRMILHELALAAAKFARTAEAQAHKVADLVSHKRSFEKRPDRTGEPSDFLKQVSEHKNGGGESEQRDSSER